MIYTKRPLRARSIIEMIFLDIKVLPRGLRTIWPEEDLLGNSTWRRRPLRLFHYIVGAVKKVSVLFYCWFASEIFISIFYCVVKRGCSGFCFDKFERIAASGGESCATIADVKPRQTFLISTYASIPLFKIKHFVSLKSKDRLFKRLTIFSYYLWRVKNSTMDVVI